MRIWAKIIKNNEIIKDIVYSAPQDMSEMKYLNYQNWVTDISNLLDIPSPVIIPHHFKNFAIFHNTHFKASDFIHPVDFDALRIEDCKD